MANIHKIINTAREMEKLISAMAAVAAAAGGVITLVVANKEKVAVELVEIPPILSTEGFMTLQEAKTAIETVGLKAGKSVAKAQINFKDCQPFDVVNRSHKRQRKVPAGTLIVLYYITDDVIEKSKQLFIESEKRKAEAERIKSENRAKADRVKAETREKKIEQRNANKELVKNKLDEKVNAVKQGVVDTAVNVKSRIEKTVTRDDKNNGINDT
jgi:hypothetical protein